MANLTFLQATNRVLTRLREDNVTTLTGADSYVALVAALVNEAKEEVESAWTWNSLIASLDITMVSGTANYSLTGWGDSFEVELAFNTTKNYYLQGPHQTADLIAAQNLQADVSVSSHRWTYYGKDSNGDPYIRFYPTPGDADTIQVVGRKNVAYMTDDADEITVPWRPVVLGAYLKAIAERGEDGGTNWAKAQMDYERALADAIGYDAALNHRSKDWRIF